jgi:nucleoside-diphosphate-sugar epimerase
MPPMTSAPKALVTGASGSIGSKLVRNLVQNGWQVFALSRFDSFTELKDVTTIKTDWDYRTEFNCPNVSHVFHLASQTSAYIARDNVYQDAKRSVLGTIAILESIRKAKINPFFIQAGSMTEFGLNDKLKLDEAEPLNPSTFYDSAKISSQLYADQCAKEGWLAASVTLRLSNVYGDSSRKNTKHRGFLDKSIANAINSIPITYFGTGQYIRDFVNVVDVVNAFRIAGEEAEKLNENKFNIGTGIGTTVYEALINIATQVKKETGIETELVQSDFPSEAYDIEKRNQVADSDLFRLRTGWAPMIELDAGIKESVLNFKNSLN